MQTMQMQLDEQTIRAKAYELWCARGCPNGTAEQDWFEAQRILVSVQAPTAKAVEAAPKSAPPPIRSAVSTAAGSATSSESRGKAKRAPSRWRRA